MKRAFALVAMASVFLPAATRSACAQDRESHWGISASYVPHWSFPEPLAKAWDLETDMAGSELRVGLVWGSDRGGDVGVSFVKKYVSDDSFVNLRETACVQLPAGLPQCARGVYHITQDAGFTGVEGHIFMPFATIGQRVQIGGTFAGGVARIDGAVDRFLEHLVVSGNSATRVTDSLGEGTFKETLQDIPQDWPVMPIGRVELSVGVLMSPGVKLRGSAGVNFPGFHFIGIYAHYLFGAN
jgi:hypothetical protein